MHDQSTVDYYKPEIVPFAIRHAACNAKAEKR
jgi:hypothetical protein